MVEKLYVVRRWGGLAVVFGLWCGGVLPMRAWETDMDSVRDLRHVTVQATRVPRQVSASVPVQVMTGEDARATGIQTVADAVRRFAGTTVKDYGGIGGLKTVSLRGFGAEHTAVAYDGLAVSNCQAGQIDIGRFNIEDVEYLTLSVGQQTDLLQSARLYASAGVLSIRTKNPLENRDDVLFAFRAQLKGGSFGMVNPSVKWAQRLGGRTVYTLSGNFLRADGSYPFTLVNGKETTREKRRNDNIISGYGEGNLFHTFHDGSRMEAKLHYFKSQRGLPGSVILYNNRAEERLWDENAFAQMRYAKTFSEKWRLQVEGKYNYAWNKYEDINVKYAGGRQTDLNTQQEYYLSGTVLWMPLENLSFSWANDGAVNTLDSNLPLNPQPVRWTYQSAFNARWQWKGLTLNGTLVGTMAKEKVEQGNRPMDCRRLSPAASLSWRPWRSEAFYFRLMYKETFRVPTFNDMYYDRMGNRELKPEKAHEFNAGVSWSVAPGKMVPRLTLSADGYYNKVEDKIVAMPSMYVWRMLNYGRVDITGTDVTMQGEFGMGRVGTLCLSAAYSWQKAWDVTDSRSKTYKHDIPYTPRHSGNVSALFDMPWISMGYSVVLVGERYATRQNLPQNRMERYGEHTLSLSRTFTMKQCRLKLQAEVVNLTDAQYEVIKYYPMPGRSYQGTVTIEL